MKVEGRKRGEKKSGSCTSSLKFASLSYESGYEDGEHKSAFLRYKVSIRTGRNFIRFFSLLTQMLRNYNYSSPKIILFVD